VISTVLEHLCVEYTVAVYSNYIFFNSHIKHMFAILLYTRAMSGDRTEYYKAYRQRPDVKVQSKIYQQRVCEMRKLQTTKQRLIKHEYDDLVAMCKQVCVANGIDYDEHRIHIEAAMKIFG